MKKNNNNVVIKNQVILNSIRDRQRLSLSLINNMRGRFQIKYGMTTLYNNCAFTLIELLVVVLIIGILAAVALPQYKVAVAKSRYATLKHLAHSIAHAQEVYYLANGKYAEDFEQLDISLPGGKLDSSTTSNYLYPWGVCHMGRAKQQAICQNSLIHMQYQVGLRHATTVEDRKPHCIAFSTDINSTSNKICKMETKQKQPHTITNTYMLWRY